MEGIVTERNERRGDIDPQNYTKACQFIRPMLGRTPTFYGDNFFNCYISVNPDLIYIVFKKPLKGDHYDYVLSELRFTEEYIETKEFTNYLVFIFKVPDIFVDDFYEFLDSKYSKFSDFYKEEILASHVNWRQVYRNLSDILYPQQKHREAIESRLDVTLPKNAEIFDSIELQEELYDERRLNEKYYEPKKK